MKKSDVGLQLLPPDTKSNPNTTFTHTTHTPVILHVEVFVPDDDDESPAVRHLSTFHP